MDLPHANGCPFDGSAYQPATLSMSLYSPPIGIEQKWKVKESRRLEVRKVRWEDQPPNVLRPRILALVLNCSNQCNLAGFGLSQMGGQCVGGIMIGR